ncbi:MAG TPA: hypothetical protein VF003_18785 [Pseudonocardiaceae bacterium]
MLDAICSAAPTSPATWTYGAAMGRHNRRVRRTEIASPRSRCPGIELVDALTRVAHRVSGDELLAGRFAGTYEALCGARLLSASLTDPGRSRCAECAR